MHEFDTRHCNWQFVAGVDEHDDEGRCITAEFDNFYLVNTYIPNAGLKLKEYALLFEVTSIVLTIALACLIARSGTKRS